MIIVTGGAGFIGSALVWKLNQIGRKDIIIVDSLKSSEKWKNLVKLQYLEYIDKYEFRERIVNNNINVKAEALFHMGACSSTTEKDADYLMENNFKYSRDLLVWALEHNCKFIYASSAATYGDGSNGYSDSEKLEYLEKLVPLNMYGYSKHIFDVWVKKNNLFEEVTGLKFFNVYGPNEYHKDDMCSVVNKAFHQIKNSGYVKLFKSYKTEYEDGWQLRDFVYVKDVVNIIVKMFDNDIFGLYNIGTGSARSFYDLADTVFKSLNLETKIEFIDMPENLKSKYQYFTQADMNKLKSKLNIENIENLESGIKDYVTNYLVLNNSHLG